MSLTCPYSDMGMTWLCVVRLHHHATSSLVQMLTLPMPCLLDPGLVPHSHQGSTPSFPSVFYTGTSGTGKPPGLGTEASKGGGVTGDRGVRPGVI
jgi:hypothetical protein